jgi:hypothetical protein
MWDRRISIISALRSSEAATIRTPWLYPNASERHARLMHKRWVDAAESAKKTVRRKSVLAHTCKKMPRTMLRYAIEKFDDETRKAYLAR